MKHTLRQHSIFKILRSTWLLLRLDFTWAFALDWRNTQGRFHFIFFALRHVMTGCLVAPLHTGWSTLELTLFEGVLAHTFCSTQCYCWKAENTAEPRGRRAGLSRGHRGPAWMGVPPKNTHQSSHITSLPSCLIGWWGCRGRGSAKNRRDGPFWLNESMRQCLGPTPALIVNISTSGTSSAFTRLLCVFHPQYITHVQPHTQMAGCYSY